MSNKRISLLLLISLSLFSCGGSKQNSRRSSKIAFDEKVLLHIRQGDIPVPVSFSPITKNLSKPTEEGTTHLRYQGNLSVEQCQSFYKLAMELNGFEIHDFSTEQEALLFCSKKNKSCAIEIRSHRKKTDIKLVLQNKKLFSAKGQEKSFDLINNKEVTPPRREV